MSDTTPARRALLALLLDRVERGALLPAEMPLLRPLIAAEQDAADNPPWPADTPAPNAPRQAADALYEAVSMLQAIGSGTWADAIECVEARAMAYDRSGGRALALDGPAPDDDTAEPEDDGTPTRDDGRPTCRRMETRTCPDSYDGQPCGDRPCARFESEDPTPWAPAGTPAAVIEALRTGQPVTFTPETEQAYQQAYRDAQQLADKIKARQQATRCSPLVNPACPGHTDAVRCDRAPSHPVTVAAAPDWAALNGFTDWATSADEQCPARYTGESPHLTESPWQPVNYRCELRGHGPDSDHAVRQPDQRSVFCWTDAIAVYPIGAARCTATIPDHSLASLGVIFQCELDAGHYDPADEPVFNDPPTTGGWHKSGDLNWSDQAEGAKPHTDTPQDPA